MLLETISTFECLVTNNKIYKGFKIKRERFMDPVTSYYGICERNMEGFYSYAHWHQYLEWEIQEDLLHCHHLHPFLLPSLPPLLLLLAKVDSDVALTSTWSSGGVGVGELFLNICFWIRMLMQCKFLFWNEICLMQIFCFCRKKRNESTTE